MYVPRVNQVDDEDAIRGLVTAVGSAEFITVGQDGFPTAHAMDSDLSSVSSSPGAHTVLSWWT